MKKEFIEIIKNSLKYKTILQSDFINELIDKFNIKIKKMEYPNNNIDSKKIVLNFFKNYNKKYYKMIIDGINKQRIIIDENNSLSNTKNNSKKTYIKLMRNDGDIIIIAHELAHYIDINSNPNIVPNEYWFLKETFAFYIERTLEKYLGEKYNYLFNIRKNNRIYMENEMLQTIKIMLKYKNYYTKNNSIEINKKDKKYIEKILQLKENNLINYYLSYPIANITSLYLSNFCKNVTNTNFCSKSLNFNIKVFFEEQNNLIGLN